jgi:hypothetical protein
LLWFRVQTSDNARIRKPNEEAFPEGENGAAVTVWVVQMDKSHELIYHRAKY